ncbi:MAG: indolepyruvate oxidoreductase subunit beta [Ruminococcaceae bacterium]|nr:indolepyruvate oxidoreductase subunit beta [Oscillospiraceae bacterium]
MNTKSIMIVGVGGQGTLLASRIIGTALMSEGYDVKVSEVHGMSQRGGSVVTYVKYGEKVFSPTVEKGEADLILCFEMLEALRYVSYLKLSGKMLVNTQRIDPMPVITGAMEYPEQIIEKIKAANINIEAFNALDLANKAGSSKAVNVVLIGALARNSEIKKEVWLDSLKKNVKEKFLEMNIKAFELGYNL